jgi:hypothetical protein
MKGRKEVANDSALVDDDGKPKRTKLLDYLVTLDGKNPSFG